MSGPWHGGKGDRRRPVDRKKWDAGWKRIFGLTDKKKDGIIDDESSDSEDTHD